MLKEQEFDELLEQQDEQNKKTIWGKINNRIDDIAVEIQSADVLVMKKNTVRDKKHTLVIVAIIIAIIFTITGILLWRLLPTKNDIRYCQVGEYFSEETTLTIKQYTQENDLGVLYFDYYNEWDYMGGLLYKLNDSDEVVCLQEDIIDPNGIMLTYYITDNLTEIDFLAAFKTVCRESNRINNTTIYWHEEMQEANALFEYNGFRYYIKAQGEFSRGYILELTQLLINTSK